MEYKAIGHAKIRVDSIEKVTGLAVYADELGFSNLLYGKAVRSPQAHAKILNIDTSRARQIKGVMAVVSGREIPVLGGEALKDYPFLAVDRVRYVGEPVVAVAAISAEIAEEAMDVITVEYEELPQVLDPLEAMQAKAPLIHEQLMSYAHLPVISPVDNSNICHHVQFLKGDIRKGFAESDHIFSKFHLRLKQHHLQIYLTSSRWIQ